ncbi:MAG: hypothetical protein J2P25_19180 [Nocardiopsaceae bacterium]|nr:hypothetical protein [Nocardiopsaceae bacterium]
MTRWSLRSHRHQAQQPDMGSYQADHGPPELGPPPPAAPWPSVPEAPSAPVAWPDIMEQFSQRMLILAEQARISLDELEAGESDPDRLQRLYRVDHALTRIRRVGRDLRTLAGRGENEPSGIDTSLLDVIRMALSAIERYPQVTIGKVAEFGVLGHAADDVAALLAALLDNATRYSPDTTSVSAHLTDSGSVLVRITDSGIGLAPDGVAALNAMLAGEVPEPDERTGRHSGLPVVHRLARQYSVGVRLAARPGAGTGTIALVTLPPELICEAPESAEPPGRKESAARPSGGDPAYLGDEDMGFGGLPRREPGSLRRGKPGSGPGDDDMPPGMPAGMSVEQQSAARLAFADDLTAFSLGSAGPYPPGAQDPTGKGTQP